MSDPRELDSLLARATGYRVRARDGHEVGAVEEVRYERARDPSHLVVVRGGRRAARRVIPFDAIDEVRASERVVVLRIDASVVRWLPRSPCGLDERRARRYRYAGATVGAAIGGLVGWVIGQWIVGFVGVVSGAYAGSAAGLAVGGGLRGDIQRDTGRSIGHEIAGDMALAAEVCAGGIAGLYIGEAYGALVGVCIGVAVGMAWAPSVTRRLSSFARRFGPGSIVLLAGTAVWASALWAIASVADLSVEYQIVYAVAGGGTVLLGLFFGDLVAETALRRSKTPLGLLVSAYRRGLPHPPPLLPSSPAFERRLGLGRVVGVFLFVLAALWIIDLLLGLDLSSGERIAFAAAVVAGNLALLYSGRIALAPGGIVAREPEVIVALERLETRVLVYPFRRVARGVEVLLVDPLPIGDDRDFGFPEEFALPREPEPVARPGDRSRLRLQGLSAPVYGIWPSVSTAHELVSSAIDNSPRLYRVLYRHRLSSNAEHPLMLEEVYAAEVPSDWAPPSPDRYRTCSWCRVGEARALLALPENRDPGAILRGLAVHETPPEASTAVATTAGRNGERRELLTDFAWLHDTLHAGGLVSLLAEYPDPSEDTAVDIVHAALQLSAHVLAEDPAQLPGQLIGRLSDCIDEDPAVARLVETAARFTGAPWLCPLTPAVHSGDGPLRRTLDHPAPVRAVAVSPDGRHVVSGDAGGTLRVWELAASRERRDMSGPAHNGAVHAVTVSPDGRLIVSGGSDGAVRVWSLAAGRELLHTLTGHPFVDAVAVSPDGRHAVSAGGDDQVRVWDVASGRQVCALAGHTGRVSAVAVSPDGRHIVSGSEDGTVRVSDFASGRECWAQAGEQPTKIPLPGPRATPFVGHTGPVNTVAVSADGHHIVSGGNDGVAVWDLATGRKPRALPDDLPAFGVGVSPDGRHIVAGILHIVAVCDLANVRVLHLLGGHSNIVTALALSPDGRHVVSASEDATVRVWELAGGLQRRRPRNRQRHARGRHKGPVTAVAISSDGRHIVSGGGESDRTVKVWEVPSGREVHTLRGHTRGIAEVAISPDGGHIVSAGGSDESISLWDLASGHEQWRRINLGRVTAVAVNSDGRYVLSRSDGTVRVWELANGHESQPFAADDPVMRLSRHGRWRVSIDDKGAVRVWDRVSSRELGALVGHARGVEAVAVGPDGRHVVSVGDWDATVHLWELESGREIARWTGERRITACATAPAMPLTIAVGDDEGTVNAVQLRGDRSDLRLLAGSR